jgi:hypothetical protein
MPKAGGLSFRSSPLERISEQDVAAVEGFQKH